MNRKFNPAMTPGLAVLAAIVFTTGCSDGSKEVFAAKTEKKIIRVNVETLEPKTFEQKLTLTASARADREVSVASETPGRVVKVGFEKGDKVVKGRPLVWLDDATVKAQIARAVADRDLAALEYKKQKALADRKANISQFELERSRLRLKSADAALLGLKANLSKLTLRAPIQGVLVSKSVEIGAIVSPGAPLTRVVAMQPIKVTTGIPERAIGDFAVGKDARVVFDALEGREYHGKVSYLSAEVDRRARVFECEIELANEDMAILPEMSAKVTFTRKVIPGSILIPQTSVLELETGHAVFIVDEEGTARQKQVEIGDISGDMALVASGVSAGEKLVILGQRSLIDGDQVVIAE